MSNLLTRDPVTVAELLVALRAQQRGEAVPTTPEVDALPTSPGTADVARTVMVLGAHPGAGTSVIALALAEALAGAPAGGQQLAGGDSVRLVDAASPEASGFAAAVQREIAGSDRRWRVGRRGSVTVLRPIATIASARDLVAIPKAGTGLTVVDAGWSWRQLTADAAPFAALIEHAQAVVVVCRASVPGVRRMELALEDLPGRPVVAVVGARRWPGAVAVSWGPRLAQVVREDRAVLVPRVRRVEVNGIDAEALPRPIAEAVGRLVPLLWAGGLGSSRASRGEGFGR